ncbi:U11/U12 small nuclear ribonucleoprotein 48 kDa protein-like [Paramacrobiotus metropolitanus]|uniref:U11/U12 small nuclear ribonucleoprotein 48 kDa protein-like n=1 Tax=Paramacrobiotus metropolitanus TaxID=2943436 RepID=UPI00244606EF|nr:U11/U12 small nuclear ribonucleoprotein 48 kDa protein-like [Paramacrobiotus metropolitanus]
MSTIDSDGTAQLLKRVRHQITTLQNVLSVLKWSEKSVTERAEYRTCSIDPNHRIPTVHYRLHLKMCEVRHLGYSDEEILEIQNRNNSSQFFYDHATNVVTVTIDEKLLNKILGRHCEYFGAGKSLPLTPSRWNSDLTADERSKIYDYVVATAEEERTLRNIRAGCWAADEKARSRPDSVQKQPGDSGCGSLVNEMIPQRKRRRISYKEKSIHTNRKSYTEELRDVIAKHMSIIQENCEHQKGEIHIQRSG